MWILLGSCSLSVAIIGGASSQEKVSTTKGNAAYFILSFPGIKAYPHHILLFHSDVSVFIYAYDKFTINVPYGVTLNLSCCLSLKQLR